MKLFGFACAYIALCVAYMGITLFSLVYMSACLVSNMCGWINDWIHDEIIQKLKFALKEKIV